MSTITFSSAAVLNRGFSVLAVILATAAAPAMARDAQAGRLKSQACMVCHGPVGISAAPDAPNLAGQPALYVAAQLKAYRAGDRRHEVMGVIARMLSDADIENLAEWYASIRIEAQTPD
jgi:cytochrome c553